MEDRREHRRSVIVDTERLYTLRRLHCWTQEVLAEKAYVSPRTIAAAEAGDPISLRTLRDIAGALEVPPVELCPDLARGLGG